MVDCRLKRNQGLSSCKRKKRKNEFKKARTPSGRAKRRERIKRLDKIRERRRNK